MNTFVTILCLALVATAAAKPGYNYQAPAPHYAGPVQQYEGPYQQQPQVFESAPQYAGPVQQQYAAPGPQYAAPGPVSHYQPTSYQPERQTIVSKEIFHHAAPEEFEEIGADQGIEAGPNRQNYRIVFIKAPAQNVRLNLDSLRNAQANNEEKTVIYVLAKKPDFGNLQGQLAGLQTQQKTHKPEVHFIKYKTQEEAHRAQQEIQAQYDALGGSTSVTDEGVGHVQSVIGSGHASPSFSSGHGGSVGPSFSSGHGGSVGPSFASGYGGSVGPSFTGGNVGSVGSSYTGGNYGSVGGSSFTGGNEGSFFGGAPSSAYLPAQRK